jgi:hypothetical protein
VVVGVEVTGTSRKGSCWRFGQQHECFQCPESRLPRRVPWAVIREKERRRPDHSARTHPAPRQRAPEDLRRPMMLRAKAGPAAPARLRPDHGRRPRCLRHDRGGVLTPVSAFDLSAGAMTMTRLTRLGSARSYVRWINLRTMSGGSGFTIESASRNERQKVEPLGRCFHRVTARGGVRPRTPRLCPRPLRRRRSDARKEPFAGHRQGSGRATSSALTVPGKTERKPGIGSTPKADPSAVIAPDARKSFVEIVFCQIAQQAVSD